MAALSNAIDAALAALDDADFEGCPAPSNDDWECQLQMKIQVFSPPAPEDDYGSESSEASESEVSTAASEAQSESHSTASKWKGKAGSLASSLMPRLQTV